MSDIEGTPSFHEALKTVFNSFLGEEINTCLPGIVDSYDNTKQKATITPAISKKFLDGEVLSYKPIENVPVLFPGSTSTSITYPIVKGDIVLLIFSQRAMENFLDKGEIVEPGDRRKFDITDAIAIPGFMTFNKDSKSTNNEDLEIYHEGAFIAIKKNKDIALQNDNCILIMNNQSGQLDINNGNLTVES